MKKNLLIMIVMMIISCRITFATDWSSNAVIIQQTLQPLPQMLLNDAAVFDSITQEINSLADIITNQDATEQGLIATLSIQFANLVQAYQDVLQQEQDVQMQNSAVLQQLKITLAAIQSTLQDQIYQLGVEHDADQELLQQLIDQYNVAVADNEQEATDLLAVLRSVSDAYTIMMQEKQVCFDGLNAILNALNTHIVNAIAGFDQLNMLINQ
jgi:hypothetical protein